MTLEGYTCPGHQVYDDLREAKNICTADETCIGVRDDDCNEKGPFFLCKYVSRSTASNCAYKKRTNYGTIVSEDCKSFSPIEILLIHTTLNYHLTHHILLLQYHKKILYGPKKV